MTSDLSSLWTRHELEIQGLEKQRADNERTILNFKNQLTKADHDHEKLKILIYIAQHEVEYLNSEKDKHQS